MSATSSPGQHYNHLPSRVPYTATAAHAMQYHTPTQPVLWNPIAHSKYNSFSTNPALGCVACNTECTEPSCSTTELTSQCTDQCVVIACNDPEHASFNCHDDHSPCDFVCDSATNCTGCDGFDAFLRCCEDACYTDGTRALNLQGQQQKQQFQADHYDWEAALSDALCNCRQLTDTRKLPTSLATDHSNSTPVPSAPINNSMPQHSSSLPYSPVPSLIHSPSSSRSFGPLPSPISSSQTIGHYDTPQQFQTPYLTCMWGSCQAQFNTLAELVGHVNLEHLQATTAPTPLNDQTSSRTCIGNQIPNQHTPDPTRFPCLWRNCTEYLSDILSSDPTKWSTADLMSVMATHLLQEHLGVQSSNDIDFSNCGNTPVQFDRPSPTTSSQRQHQEQGQNRPKSSRFGHSDSINMELDAGSTVHPAQPTSRPEVEPLVSVSSATLSSFSTVNTTTSNSSDATPDVHICRWESCGMVFKTCNELTAHMTTAHVGGGKPRYDCLWEGCGRNRDNRFSSKQKILRHLQSHTGYRPFQCPECHQNFSEAATLQQHIRRHTQEKPYVCDYPGCGKSFAITGALTIHKRVHNGSKPFKCTYCERAFAESSNLSKHLRTHTGERPYKCLEPGCEKAFARPDQLTRHMGIHGRKRMNVVVPAT